MLSKFGSWLHGIIFFADSLKTMEDCLTAIRQMHGNDVVILRNEIVLAEDRIRVLVGDIAEDVAKLDRRLVAISGRVDNLLSWAGEMHNWAKQISDKVTAFHPTPQQPPGVCNG